MFCIVKIWHRLTKLAISAIILSVLRLVVVGVVPLQRSALFVSNSQLAMLQKDHVDFRYKETP